LDRFEIKYENTFSGATIGSLGPSSGFQEPEGVAAEPVRLENTLSGGFRITRFITASAVTVWNWQPVASSPFEAGDPYLKIGHNELVSVGNFSMSGDVRISAPMSKDLQHYHLITSVASEQISRFTIPASRFAFKIISFIQKNFHAGTGNPNEFEAHLTPAIELLAIPTLSLILAAEISYSRRVHPELGFMHHDGSSLQPGVSWDITPEINFSPYLDLRFAQTDAQDEALFAASFNWKIL
jgi:hypothetical protein